MARVRGNRATSKPYVKIRDLFHGQPTELWVGLICAKGLAATEAIPRFTILTGLLVWLLHIPDRRVQTGQLDDVLGEMDTENEPMGMAFRALGNLGYAHSARPVRPLHCNATR
jgi:hypothetical protein